MVPPRTLAQVSCSLSALPYRAIYQCPPLPKWNHMRMPLGRWTACRKHGSLAPGSSGTAELASGDRQSPGPEEAPGQRIMLTFTTYPRESGWQSALALGGSACQVDTRPGPPPPMNTNGPLGRGTFLPSTCAASNRGAREQPGKPHTWLADRQVHGLVTQTASRRIEKRKPQDDDSVPLLGTAR
jgi:hypothetical protein